jgi:hypothetical protein
LTAVERLKAGPANWIELQAEDPETVYSDEDFNETDEILYWDGFTDDLIKTDYETAVDLSSGVGKIILERFSDLNPNFALNTNGISFRDVR